MRLNVKKSFLFSIVLILLLVPTAYAIPGTWRGFAMTDGSLAASGTVVDGYLNNVTESGNATVKEVSTWPDGYYLINVVGTLGDKINFKVCGVTVAIPSQDWSEGLHPNGTYPYINLSVSKLASGVSCTYSCGCSGGHCCSDATEYTAGEGTGTCQASACVAPTATTAAPSAGGGGVAGTTATTTPPVKETKTVASISAGGTGTFSFETVPISEIEVDVKNAVTNVQIAVTKTDAAPATVSIAAPGTVYAYFNIEKINVDDANVNKVTIKFKVDKSWITNNNIDTGTITLNRYVNGTWIALTTKLVSSNGYYYFEAESPGLSVFAVTAQQKPTTTTLPSATTTVPATTTTLPFTLPKISTNTIYLIVGVIIIIIVLVIVISISRSGKPSKETS
jgi:PGF-pre-PGF domain-containing protein